MRVVIVEDHGWLREALAEALPGRGVEVVGQAGDSTSALAVIDRTAPDVALLDIRLPPTFSDEGLRIAESVRGRYPQVGLLVLSSHAEVAIAERLVNLQDDPYAIGYLLKERVGDLGEVVDAVHRVAAGEVVIDPSIVARLMSRRRTVDPLETLTPYERRVLGLVAEGRSNLGIARHLGIQISTVEKHLTSITGKLGLPQLEAQDRRTVNVRVLAALAFLRSST
ncbi:response regulator transcription factor [Kineococcus gypseus]|uniref:response regulator n=1 Tax=Kineococcus gypseus TaxID=1637102 RepID=UPI003D7E1FDE